MYPIRYFEILSNGDKRFLTVEENDKAQEIWTKKYEEKYQILLKEKLKEIDNNDSSDSVATIQKELLSELEVPSISYVRILIRHEKFQACYYSR